MNSKTTTACTVALSILLATGVAWAHGGAMGIVKERMDAMSDVGKSMKAISDMMKGKQDYDAAKVRDHAKAIASHGGDNLTKLFPEGSLDFPTEALPKIWEDWDGFSSLANQLTDYAGALGQAADNDRRTHAGPGMMGQGGMMQDQGTMMEQGGMMGGQGGMMGGQGGMMMGGMDQNSGPSAEHLATMPPDAAFMHLAQTCASCHQNYRKKKQ